MRRVYLDLALSLDAFTSGPNGEDDGLHDWYFAEQGAADEIGAELLNGIGAMIPGHTAFGTVPDGFDTEDMVPPSILTHRPRPSVERNGFTFIFVNGDLGQIVALAKAAAGERDVCVAGGGNRARHPPALPPERELT